ncbi:MAG: thrombospondin type 3 repeat-containing protein [Promethearchaeota archaeon]
MYIWGTNASDSDSDDDGLRDGEEISLGIDGYLTDPKKVDSDGDGFSDYFEYLWHTNPNDPTLNPWVYLQVIIGALIIISIPVAAKLERRYKRKQVEKLNKKIKNNNKN